MKIQLYTILVYSKDTMGVLSEVTNVFSSSKLSINSLSTSSLGSEKKVCITITVFVNKSYLEVMAVKLGQLDHVFKVIILTNNDLFYQKLALFKVEITKILNNPFFQEALMKQQFNVVEVNSNFMIFSKIGNDEQLEKLYNKLKPLGIAQWTQSGLVSITIEETMIDNWNMD